MAIALINDAMAFAIERHGPQMYGQKPYHVHLMDTVNVLRRFFDWEALPQEFVNAAWLHDVIEDTETTREEIERAFGQTVGTLVWAVSNEPGANRAIRHALTYPKVRETMGAINVKLADRIANLEQSVSHDRFGRPPQNLFWMYNKEWGSFQRELRTRCAGESAEAALMWSYLDDLFREGHRKADKYKDLKTFGGDVG